MVVGGLPEFTDSHADRVVSMAFGMIHVSSGVYSPVEAKPIQVKSSVCLRFVSLAKNYRSCSGYLLCPLPDLLGPADLKLFFFVHSLMAPV